MLSIDQSQLSVFEAAAMRGFTNEMVKHCFDFSPELCETLGEDQVRAAVEDGIDRARDYGFLSRGPVQLFLEAMMQFGGRFDTDPVYAWAHGILSDAEEVELDRATRLHANMTEYLEVVAGPEGALGQLPHRALDIRERHGDSAARRGCFGADRALRYRV